MNFKVLPAPIVTDSAILGVLSNQEKKPDLLSYYSKSGKNNKHNLLMCIYVFLY